VSLSLLEGKGGLDKGDWDEDNWKFSHQLLQETLVKTEQFLKEEA
jgi:hypothetical protein